MVFFTMGQRIRYVRKFRGMTQEELATKIGLSPDENGRTRISQYENDIRTPKDDILKKISEALDVKSFYLSYDEHTAMTDFVFTLFEHDDAWPISIYKKDEHFYLDLDNEVLDDFLDRWMRKKADLKDGKISERDYIEWKINFPFIK